MKRKLVVPLLLILIVLTGCSFFESTYTVRGTVTSNLEPIADAKVVIDGMMVETDHQGWFTFTKVSEGRHIITAEKFGYEDYSETILVETDISTLRLDLTELPKYNVQVRTRDQDSEASVPATITIRSVTGGFTRTAYGEANTIFENIPIGDYTITAETDTHYSTQKTITVNGNEEVNLYLEKKLYVYGTVRDSETNALLSGVTVSSNGRLYTTSTDGQYKILTEPGSVALRATKSGYEDYTKSLELTTSDLPHNISLNPVPVSDLTVQVFDEGFGPGFINAVITLKDAATNQTVDIIEADSDEIITFTNIEDGRYQLLAEHQDCYDATSPEFNVPETTSQTITLEWKHASATGELSFGYRYDSFSPQSQDFSGFEVQGVELPNSSITAEYDGVIVKFLPETTEGEIQAILQELDVQNYKVTRSGLYHLLVNHNAEEIMFDLQTRNEVDLVQLNYIHTPMGTPNDTLYPNQWNLNMINLPLAWQYAHGEDNSVLVAVLDTGIKYNADLAPNIDLASGFDIADDDNDPTDDVTPDGEFSHGTHIASIIGAVTNNSTYLAGAGWNMQVVPIKVFTDYVDGSPVTDDATLAEGIHHAINISANVINLSLGNSDSPNPYNHPILEAALADAYAAGITVFASAGNEGQGTISYPASSDYTFAVGAVDYYENRASYSNYGSNLDLVAPGGGGPTGDNWAWTDGIAGYVDQYQNSSSTGMAFMIGTSQATAHASAAAGLVYSLGITDPDEIYNLLRDSADYVGNEYEYGAGLLDVGEALRRATGEPDFSEVETYTAFLEGGNWHVVDDDLTVDITTYGSYSIDGIAPYMNNLYIIALVDQDKTDYFGYKYIGNLDPNQHIYTDIKLEQLNEEQQVIFPEK